MLTEKNALLAYARMLNTLWVGQLEPILAEDFHYTSQAVFQELTSKAEFLDYMTRKLETIRLARIPLFAELGEVDVSGSMRPCVIVAQGDKESLEALVLAEVDDGRLKRLDMCVVAPHPSTAQRSGRYPDLRPMRLNPLLLWGKAPRS
jgi:hypothetical protein